MTDPDGLPTLLLIHGLGANRGVWSDLRSVLSWDGRVVAPDLPGHGAAGWSGDYTVGALAAALSAHCENGERVIVVGHSLGGGVGLALASGMFRPVVAGVIAVGVKVAWTAQDVETFAAVAAKGVRWFDSRDQAIDRFLRQSGLVGVVDPDHPASVDAVAEEGGRWRVAQDPATFAQRALEVRRLIEAARCPIVMGAGDGDEMVTEAELAELVAEPRIALGRGHNVHVEDPAWVANLITELRR